MVTDQGVDVNVVDDWRSTMMANSAHDPFWKAKVSHEVQVNPAHQAQLEDKCTSCHAPAGRHDKHLLGDVSRCSNSRGFCNNGHVAYENGTSKQDARHWFQCARF